MSKNVSLYKTNRQEMSRYAPKRLLWLSLGVICLLLGFIGAFLPLLPTTVFLLIAAFAFAKSSPRLHDWLLNHPQFGTIIKDWHRHGAISKKAKYLSAVSMSLIVILSVALGFPLWIIAVQILALGAVSLFLWTRPLPPK